MLTESSKPTMAKKASVVAAITGQKTPPLSGAANVQARETSPWPPAIAQKPMPMMISRPVSSTTVRTTFILTLSPTPRKLMAATRAMKPTAISGTPQAPRSRLSEVAKLEAKAREAVAAEVMPEDITAKATRNVTKWIPKALWV